MAVLQISKIQVRRGQKSQTGIPTLSAGEFAWAVDAQELYIGNGSVNEGAPFVGNTRLLTELDANNIFQLASSYIYRSTDGSPIQTGPTANDPVRRTLQDKLDEYVSVWDFGAKGDGFTDDTKALQTAVDQTYLNTAEKNLPISRKKLRVPAGTYLITGTIYVPSYTQLEGDGIDRVYIKQVTTSTAIFQTIDFDSTPSNRITFPNIQSGPTHQPRFIEIRGMTLQYDSSTKQAGTPLISVDCAKDMTIEEVKFKGLAVSPDNDTLPAVELRAEGALKSEYVTIKNCTFENMFSGILSDYDVENINVLDCQFQTMFRAIDFNRNLSGIAPQLVGPRKVNVRNSYFTDVFSEAIYVGPNTLLESSQLVSENNRYDNCGNEGSLNADQEQAHPVLILGTPNNQSINDWFSRDEANDTGTPSPAIPAIYGHIRVAPNVANSMTLSVVSFDQPILTVAKLQSQDMHINIDYVANQPSVNNTRVGQVKVLAGNFTATVYDTYQYSGASALINNLEFVCSLNTGTQLLEISANNPVGSVITNLTYSYQILY